MRKNYIILTLLLLVLALSVLGCGVEEVVQEDTEDKLTVYSSFYPIHFITEAIGGDRIDAKSVVPSGNEVHGYEISPRKMADLEDSDFLFYIGLELEPWAERAVANLQEQGVATYKVSQGLDLLDHEDNNDHSNEDHHEDGHDQSHDHSEDQHHEDEHDHAHGDYDPHVWLDPVHMQQIATAVKDKLIELDPEGAEVYEANYEELKQQFIDLDKKYKTTLANRDRDHFLVSHSAFAYLAERYELEELSVTGITSHQEPSPHRLRDLIHKVEEYDLSYIYLEVLAASEVAEVLAEEVGLEILTLDPIEGLADENDDYFSVMERNLENLAKELVD